MSNNEHKLEVLMGNYRDMIIRIAIANVRNKEDAEDILQEVAVRYLKNLPEFQNQEHEKAWFIRTTINLCYDFVKTAWNRKTTGLDLEVCADKFVGLLKLPFIEDDDETLEKVLELPLIYRNPIYLFYYEDYSIKEIADIIGENENTVKTRLRRGRDKLKRVLATQ